MSLLDERVREEQHLKVHAKELVCRLEHLTSLLQLSPNSRGHQSNHQAVNGQGLHEGQGQQPQAVCCLVHLPTNTSTSLLRILISARHQHTAEVVRNLTEPHRIHPSKQFGLYLRLLNFPSVKMSVHVGPCCA